MPFNLTKINIIILVILFISFIDLFASSEFQVNTYTDDSQDSPSAAVDDNGNIVIVWTSDGQDGSGYGVFAQRYDSLGNSVGSEFQVNSYTSFDQNLPSVAMDSDGNFVITWTSDGQDGSTYGIYAQRYDSSGNPAGSEFQVNTYITSYQIDSSIAMDSNGDFVITWTSFGQDGSSYGIFAQRYDSSGNPVGSEFQVNTYKTDIQDAPSVAMDGSGNFIITWQSEGQDGSSYGVYAQRYDSTGNTVGIEFQVNTYTSGYQSTPSAAMDTTGNCVITWTSEQDGSSYGIFAQRYDSTGNTAGSEFQVNSYTNGLQMNPSASVDDSGNFIVTWQSENQDSSGYGIFAQRYDSSGNTVGSEYQVNTYTSNTQSYPSAAMDTDGDFTIAWQSEEQDGSNYGIYASLYFVNPTPTPTATSTITSTITDTITPTITVTLTPTQTLTPTFTQTKTETPTQTITQTPTQTMTLTITPTITQTSTQTETTTLTPTKTPTQTISPTLSATSTITKTATLTKTPTITWYDMKPVLSQASVTPDSGDQSTMFEYLVHFVDPDGGYPPLRRIYINGSVKSMNNKLELSENWFTVDVPGIELNDSKNEYYFIFNDDEGNSVRYPMTDSFSGPSINASLTATLTTTETKTPVQTPVETRTVTPSITPTPPDECLYITNPPDFYHNTVLVSWTPIINASYYKIDYVLNGIRYAAELSDNFIRVNLRYEDEWRQFVEVGALPFRVTAYDSSDYVIDGPTRWFRIVCQPDYEHFSSVVSFEKADPGCLRISNPPNFYQNTILLSWTPVKRVDHYLFEYIYKGEIYTADLKQNWLRLIVNEGEVWNIFTSFVKIEFRVSAIDSDGNIIDGPTDWFNFTCE